MLPIQFIRLLNEVAGLSLRESKDIKEKILDNISVEVLVDNLEIANEIVLRSVELGVACHIT